MNSKYMKDIEALTQRRTSGAKVVFTNGCFDILHVGHVRYLEAARALGSMLVVGINSDESVRRLKGSERPIVPENERKEVLLALKSVDAAILFDEDTPLELIQAVQPDFLVKGGDWPVEKIIGADFVQSTGGKVLSLPFVEGKSSTNILEKIKRGG